MPAIPSGHARDGCFVGAGFARMARSYAGIHARDLPDGTFSAPLACETAKGHSASKNKERDRARRHSEPGIPHRR